MFDLTQYRRNFSVSAAFARKKFQGRGYPFRMHPRVFEPKSTKAGWLSGVLVGAWDWFRRTFNWKGYNDNMLRELRKDDKVLNFRSKYNQKNQPNIKNTNLFRSGHR